MSKYDRFYMACSDAIVGEACDSFCLGFALACGLFVVVVVW